ncbi:MAG: substrate-binding domain-containing protein [Anaerolineales bacterium]|nr:substrate-binding domain-containing protein [Anaerolineales bacterium]
MSKFGRIVALLAVLSMLLGACAAPAAPAPAGAEPAAAPAGDKPVVGLVMKSLANEFFKTMEEGAVKYANEDGTFELVPVGMNSETDIDTQINAVDNFVTQGVAMIVLAPADSVGLVPSVKKAVDAGITVVNFDVKLDDQALADAGLKDMLFVGPDNEEGAYLAGAELARVLGKDAKVVIIEGNPGADNAKMRKAGFDRAAQEFGLNVLESTTAHWETEEANTLMTNLITKYPEMQGVMAANDSMALGVVKAIEAAGLTGKIRSSASTTSRPSGPDQAGQDARHDRPVRPRHGEKRDSDRLPHERRRRLERLDQDPRRARHHQGID